MDNRGQIGDPKFLYAEFSFFRLDIDSSHRLMDPEKGGGVLLDIGVYPLFLAYLIFGRPKKIVAQSITAKTGVDVQTSMILQYENAQAILYCGIANESDNNAKVGGTEGEILLHGFWHNAQKVELTKGGDARIEDFPSEGNGFIPEIKKSTDVSLQVKKKVSYGAIKMHLNWAIWLKRFFSIMKEK